MVRRSPNRCVLFSLILMLLSFTGPAWANLDEMVNTEEQQEQAEAAESAEQGDGVYDSSAVVQSQDSGASTANMLAAAALAPACFSKPPNIAACAMMAMALMQSGANNNHHGYAGWTQDSAAPDGGWTDSDPDSYLDPDKSNLGDAEGLRGGSGLTAGQQRELNAAKDILSDNGFGIDGNGTVTSPDGTKIPASAFSNPSGLSGFGLSDSLVEDVKKAQSTAAAALKDVKLGSGEAGGGGSKSSAFANGMDEFDPSKYAYKAGGKDSGKKPKGSQFAGFSRNLAGDRIGVAGDNIFQMVHRRYQAKNRSKYFLP